MRRKTGPREDSIRVFKDERGRIWKVTKVASNLKVSGQKGDNETLYEIARSCARALGITQTESGIPLEYINEHRRIWGYIWNKGQPAPD
jgi:hypothetical protein